jgi:ABC-2 type transport system ATP-binding protein
LAIGDCRLAPAILIDGLTKDYPVGFWRRRPHRALDRLSLSIDGGEIFGFLGPNGAGKTTTLKLLMRLIYPSAGRGEILGRPLGDVSTRARIGYLPETPSFYEYLTAEELMTYFAGLFGYDAGERRRRVTALLDRAGLGGERRDRIRTLSKGTVQRLGIAQALLNDPELVFLDEPMSGLDPLGRRDVRALILELREQGRTVFFSSHILSDAEAICSRIAVLADGRLAAEGRLAELQAATVRGWEIVVERASAEAIAGVRPATRSVTKISEDRYSLELRPDASPDSVLAALVASDASIVSLNPLRQTLEEFFVQRVSRAGSDARH